MAIFPVLAIHMVWWCVSDKPSVPLNLRVVDQAKTYITVAWDEPHSDGGTAIRNYTVEKQDSGRMTWSNAGEVDADKFKCKVSRLFEGSSYYFRVAATNALGTGPYAEMDSAIKAKLPFGTSNVSTFISNIYFIF